MSMSPLRTRSAVFLTLGLALFAAAPHDTYAVVCPSDEPKKVNDKDNPKFSAKPKHCGFALQDVTLTPLDPFALYKCAGGTITKLEECPYECVESTKSWVGDECATPRLRPSLWEHGHVFLEPASATLEGGSNSPASYPINLLPGPGFRPGQHGIILAPDPLEAGKNVPFAFYNNPAQPLPCPQTCAAHATCFYGVCEPDYSGTFSSVTQKSAILLHGAAAGGTAKATFVIPNHYADGALVSRIAFVVMGEGLAPQSAGSTAGEIVITRRAANGAISTQAVPLVVGTHIRAARTSAASPAFATKPTQATELYAGPCADGVGTCFLDWGSVSVSPEQAKIPIVSVVIQTAAKLRIHAITLRPAAFEVTNAAGAKVPYLNQGACAWDGEPYGGRVYEVSCANDTTCDPAFGTCVNGKCKKLWGSHSLVGPKGCLLTSTTMVVNFYERTIADYPHLSGNAVVLGPKPPPHTPAEVNRFLQWERGFSGIEVGRALNFSRSVLDFWFVSCEQPSPEGPLPFVASDAYRSTVSDPARADQFCSNTAAALDSLSALATPGAPLSAGSTIEVLPGACLAPSKERTDKQKHGLTRTALAPTKALTEVAKDSPVLCGTALFSPDSGAACSGKPADPVIPARFVLLSAEGKEVALLEMEEGHPFHQPTPQARCVEWSLDGFASSLPPPQQLSVPAGMETLLLPWYDVFDNVPCTPARFARVAHVLDPNYTFLGTEKIFSYGNFNSGLVAKAAGLPDPIQRNHADTDSQAQSEASSREAEAMLAKGFPVIFHVKNKGHFVLGTGIAPLWVQRPHGQPSKGLLTGLDAGWIGSYAVADPGRSLSHTLAAANGWQATDSQSKAAETSTATNFRYFSNTHASWRAFPAPAAEAPPPGGPGELRIRVYSPAAPLLETASGARVGFDAASLEASSELDEAHAGRFVDFTAPLSPTSDPSADEATQAPINAGSTWLITHSSPEPEPLTLLLTGTGSGPVRVEVSADDALGATHEVSVSFEASRHAVMAYEVLLPHPPGAPLELRPLAQQDLDSDGYLAPADCAEGDAATNPGAPEVCGNGKDDDCDGLTDAAAPSCTFPPACLDEDEDGFADCNQPGCLPHQTTCGDCDDWSRSVFPGAPEHSNAPGVCNDGIDNDCDGLRDDEEPDCRALPFARVGTPCAFDFQCGAGLYCDALGSAGGGAFTCQTRGPTGALCEFGAACGSGLCGLGSCCSGATGSAPCPSVDLDLGALLGPISLSTLGPDGCYHANLPLSPCGPLASCTLAVSACTGPEGLSGVQLSTTLSLGSFGTVALSGEHAEDHFCLSGPLPSVAGLPFALSGAQAALCHSAGGGTTLELSGQLTGFGAMLDFDGAIVATSGGLAAQLSISELALGPFAVRDVTLQQAPGSPQAGLGGTLALPGSGLALGVSGALAPSGAASLTLSAGGAPWTPVPGLSFAGLTGNLSRSAAGAWSLAVDFDHTVTLGPLSQVHVSGTLAASPDGLRLRGCLAVAVAGQSTLAALVPLSGLTADLCFDPDGSRRIFANLSGTLELFGDPAAFSGTLALGPQWQLRATVAGLALGPIVAQDATLVVSQTPTGAEAALEVTVSAQVGGAEVSLLAAGAYAESGPMSLAVRLLPGTTFPLLPGVEVGAVSGALTRDTAGAYALSVAVQADVSAGPFANVHVAGTLDAGGEPLALQGCLDANAATEQGSAQVGPVSLEALHFGLCVGGPTQPSTLTVDGAARLFGAPTAAAFSGALTVAAQWSLSLAFGELALGPLSFDTVALHLEPTPAGVSATLNAEVTLGQGPAALPLLVSGAYTASGPISLSATLASPPWSPLAGLSLQSITGALSGQNTQWTAALEASGTATVLGSTVACSGALVWNGLLSATLELSDLALGPFSVQYAALELTEHANHAVSAALSARLRLGTGSSALNVLAQGALESGSGDAALSLSLPPGEPWTPLPGLQISAVSGALTRQAGVFAATLDVDTEATVGPLGVVGLSGALAVDNGGERVHGCLQLGAAGGGPLSGLTLAGVALPTVAGEVCIDGGGASPTTITVALYGEMVIAGEQLAFEGELALGAGYTLTLSATDAILGGIEFPLVTLTISAPSGGAPSLVLSGFVRLGAGSGALNAQFSGTYSPQGSFSLALSLLSGTAWTPLPGVTIQSLGGNIQFSGGAWSATAAVSTAAQLPLLGPVQVGGNLQASVSPAGTSLSGCLSGTVPASQLGVPGASGTATVQVCAGPTGTTLTFGLSQWQPLPGIALPTVTGTLVQAADGSTTATVSATQPQLNLAPGLTIEDATVTATLAAGAWTVAVSGHTTVSLGGHSLSLTVAGALDSSGVLTLSGAVSGALEPLAALGPGLSFFRLEDPAATLELNVGSGAVEVVLASDVVFDLFGTAVTASVQGGAALGSTAALWFTGAVSTPDTNNDGQPDPLFIPGFPPIEGAVCFGAATQLVPNVALCGKTAPLEPGITLVATSELPVELVENQPAAFLQVQLQSLTQLSVEASLDFAWTLAQPSDNLPGIDEITITGLSLFADINGANFEVGLAGAVDFRPSGQASSIAGQAQLSFSPPSTLGVELSLDGRWIEPFGLPHIAVQDPAMAVGVTIAYPPVPTRLGFNGNVFWNKAEAWPPENLDASEHCGNFADDDGDGKTDCADPSCAQDLFCVASVASVGATFFFDAIPTESGLCLGVCLPLPPLIVRFSMKNLGLSDVAAVIEDVREGALGVLTSVSPTVASVLGTAPLPVPDLSELEFEIRDLGFYLSTHNMDALGQWWTAGLAAKLDASIQGTDVKLDGALDANGLLVSGRVSPFDLFGVDLLANPFAREVAPGPSGSLRINHSAALQPATPTYEGWVKKAAWSTNAFGALLASKETSTAGFAIGLGAPTSVCVDGAGCAPHAKVTVRFRSGGQTRTVSTAQGVVPAGKLTHVAVTWRPVSGTTRVEIWVNGESAPVVDSGPASLAPATNTAALVLAKGLDRADDLRIWSAARTRAQIAGRAQLLQPGFANDPTLVGRFECDYDKPTGTAFNSKGGASALHASYVDGASSVAATEGQDLAFRLGLLLNGGEDNGLLLRAGARLPMPLVGANYAFSALVRVNAGSALGVFYAPDVPLLAIPGAGSLVVGGFGPNGIAGDFDDGLYGAVDLLAASLQASAKLDWLPAAGARSTVGSAAFSFVCPPGATCASPAQHVLTANGTLDLDASFPAGLGSVGIAGAASFSSATQKLEVGGALSLFGKDYASGKIVVTPQHAKLTAAVALPKVLGLDLGTLSLSLTLSIADGTFCGTGSYTQPKNTTFPAPFECEVTACIGPTTLDASLACESGIQPCGASADCPSGKVCNLFLCSDPLADGAVCTSSAVCASGHCAGLCYTPLSRSDGQTCNVAAPNNCKQGLVCVGICLALTSRGGLCTHSAQCPAGTTCKASGLVTKCLTSGVANGGACFDAVECGSANCTGFLGLEGKCACTATSCASGQFCNGSTCQNKLTNGSSCGSGAECSSGKCGLNKCYSPGTAALSQTCFANDHCGSNFCDVPLFASSGTCRCDADADCGSGLHCDAGACVGPVGDFGTCRSELWCASTANCMDKDIFGNGKCVTPSGRGVGQSCVNDTHCTTGACDLIFKVCRCTNNPQCGSGKYCDSGDCKNKKSDFSGCSSGAECTGGSCTSSFFGTCFTPGARTAGQTCATNGHCASGLLCDGKCYAPNSANVGQTCVNGNHCKSNLCDPIAKVCRCTTDSHCGSGKFCESVNPTQLGTCKNKLAGGELCGLVGNVCASGTCSWGFCACSSQSQCPSSKYCENTYCNAKKSAGSGCSTNVQCSSGSCTTKTSCFLGICTSSKTCN